MYINQYERLSLAGGIIASSQRSTVFGGGGVYCYVLMIFNIFGGMVCIFMLRMSLCLGPISQTIVNICIFQVCRKKFFG
jgi:hypothetical protein